MTWTSYSPLPPRSVLQMAFAALVLLVLVIAGPASAEGRKVALVIGNSAYTSVPKLVNPANDAADIGAALTDLGFEVDIRLDMDLTEMLTALREFGAQARTSDFAIVYYAGHGIEIGGENYMIPVGAQLKADIDVSYEAVPLELAVASVEGARTLSLVIVDACRDNPFLATIERTSAKRSIGRGLALIEPEGNTLVAYSAREGTTAADGAGRNSPYADAILLHLGDPDLEIGMFFRRVRDQVLLATNGGQEPFLYGSLSADPIFLSARAAIAAPEPVEAGTTPEVSDSRPASEAVELAFWTSISSSTDPLDYEEYLSRFPAGVFVSLAERRLATLRSTASTALIPEPQPKAVPAVQPAPPLAAETPLVVTREIVWEVQARLSVLGYEVGVLDGLKGPRSRTAISAYQRAASLPVTGEIDAAFLQQLAQAVSDDRLRLSLSAAARPSGTTATGAAYCMAEPDGTVSDGLSGRPLMCHVVWPRRNGDLMVETHLDYLRASPEAPVRSFRTELSSIGEGAFQTSTGVRFDVTDSEVRIGGNRFLRSQPRP